jgi:hypothetical protein
MLSSILALTTLLAVINISLLSYIVATNIVMARPIWLSFLVLYPSTAPVLAYKMNSIR